MRNIVSAVALVLAIALPAVAQQEEPGSPRAKAPLTILQINDVYSTIPVDGNGGLARVATLKKRLIAAGRTPILIIAGDFLSPSVASSVFKGQQMIDAFDTMGLDIATLGNHEFDFGDDLLIERMKAAKFAWLVSNVIDTNTNRPIGDAAPYLIRTFGNMKVGFIGLCLNTDEISRSNLKHTLLLDPLATAGRYVPILKKQGADVIVLVSHLAYADDRAIVTKYPQIDLVVGGHEHYPITGIEGHTLISKAGSDARWVARIDLDRRPAVGKKPGELERFYELVPINNTIPDDPLTAAIVKSYEDRLGTALDEVVGETKVPLDADTVRMRVAETNIGDFMADATRADVNADVAIINSGGIRGDKVYAAGPLTKRTILAIHPLGNTVCKIEATGLVILQALESGVSKLPASAGQFPQVSGLTMKVDTSKAPGTRVSDVMIGGKPLDPAHRYTIATSNYMLGGGDGYSMFTGQKVLVGPETGNLQVAALEKLVREKTPIAPQIEGRISIK